jgi:hypothetical protein
VDTKRVVLAALAVIGVSRAAPAATSCEASVHATLSRVERKELVTTHTYTVDVATQEPCATIRFTLYTTERLSKTKVKVVKTGGEVRLRDGATSTILDYDMPNGREMVKWEVKLSGCERCGP